MRCKEKFWKGSTLKRVPHHLHVFAVVNVAVPRQDRRRAVCGCLVNFLPTTFLRHDSSSTHEIRHGRRRRRRSLLPRASARAPLRQDGVFSLRRRIQPREGRLRLLPRPPVAVPPLGPPAGRCGDADPAANGAPHGGSEAEGELRLLPRR